MSKHGKSVRSKVILQQDLAECPAASDGVAMSTDMQAHPCKPGMRHVSACHNMRWRGPCENPVAFQQGAGYISCSNQ